MTPAPALAAAPPPAARAAAAARYARCLEASRRVRWDIERDVIRGRRFDLGRSFLPAALSRVDELGFLTRREACLLSQVQGRTYANMLALVERFIGARTVALARDHGTDHPEAMEALARLTDDELKHQALFRCLDAIAAGQLPPGHAFVPDPDTVARAVLGRSTWAVMALALHLELSALAHYRASIDPADDLCPLWKDVFLYHWKEASQHANLDELEWRRVHAAASPAERERGVSDLVALVDALDALVQAQAASDAGYFLRHAGRAFTLAQQTALRERLLAAYRWQYVVAGAREPRLGEVVRALVTPAQAARLRAAVARIAAQVAPSAKVAS